MKTNRTIHVLLAGIAGVSLLVMAILGGAILPPLQGLIADTTKNLQISFIVPLLAYAYVAFYGAKGHSIGRNKQSAEVAS